MAKEATILKVGGVSFILESVCGMTFMNFEKMCKKAEKDGSWTFPKGTTIKKVYDTLANAVHKADITTVMPKK